MHSLQIYLIIVILAFFNEKTNYGDLAFCMSLLGSQTHILKEMGKMQWIFPGILIPLALSQVMLYQWVELGSGNANFLFFQGMILSVFSGLGILEFVVAALKYKLQHQDRPVSSES